MKLITLADAISRVHELPAEYILYSPINASLTPELVCALIGPEDWVDEGPPKDYDSLGKVMIELLLVESLQDVILNAYEQRPGASIEAVIEALEFYREWDAFIDFNEPNPG